MKAGSRSAKHAAHELDRLKTGVALREIEFLHEAGELRAVHVLVDGEAAFYAEQHVEVDLQAHIGVARDLLGIVLKVTTDARLLRVHHHQAGPDGQANSDYKRKVALSPHLSRSRVWIGQAAPVRVS
ncbi:hypothetical protein LP419_27145 [Massilia sp. H-1]|nr:hypothetical protein LP419_27145 [Massilia sp. H-1]